MTQAIFDHLAAPFPAERISWRVGSTTADKSRGMALAYIDARDVMERLDAVCGPGGWQRRHPHVNGTTTCEIGVKVGEEWIWKSDGSGDTDVEAEKGSLSTAFKRAAVNWGIGRYLYDLASPWVELEQRGRTSIIKESEYGKLRNLLDQRTAQVRAEPSAPLPPVKPTSGRKSSAQAKKDADDVKIKADIGQCDRAGLKDWHTNFDSYTAHLPTSWLDSIHNMLELRLEEIVGEEHIASEAADLDAGFRGAIGGASPGRVAGNGSAVAA